MKKPEKKREYLGRRNRSAKLYNQAIDEYEKFLPSEKELFQIILDFSWTMTKSIYVDKKFPEKEDIEKLAKAIAKRIGK